MPRVVTYDDPKVQAEFAERAAKDSKANSRVPAPRRRRRLRQQAERAADAGTTPLADAPTKDDYLAKIAKYVPAESITFVTLMFAAFEPTGNTVWVYVAGGAVANMLYLLSTALSAPPTLTRPRWFFYMLSGAAFWLWALATVDAVQKKANITGDTATTKQTAILAAAAFIIPALDTIFSNVRLTRR